MQVLRILALGVSLLCSSAALAQEAGKKPVKPLVSRQAAKPPVRPQPSPLDPRLVVFPYTPNYIYPIPTKLNDFTHIEFPEGERVIDVTLGTCENRVGLDGILPISGSLGFPAIVDAGNDFPVWAAGHIPNLRADAID